MNEMKSVRFNNLMLFFYTQIGDEYMDTKRRDEEIYDELCKNEDLVHRYQKAGLYSIHIEDKLVYIGKSRNMLKRLASHMANTETSKSHKYEILRQARDRGLKI